MSHLESLRKTLGGSVALDFFQAEQLRRAGKLAEAASLYEAVLKKKQAGEVYEALAEIYRRHQPGRTAVEAAGGRGRPQQLARRDRGRAKKILADDKLYTALLHDVQAHHASAEEANYPPLLAAAVLAAAQGLGNAPADSSSWQSKPNRNNGPRCC